MKTCPKCSYERRPEDDGFISSMECPRCGVVYDKFGGDTGEREDGAEPPLMKDEATPPPERPTQIQDDSTAISRKPLLKVVTPMGILLLCIPFVWYAFSVYQTKQQYSNTYRAIKKIQVSVQSGVNFQDFGRAVNDAKLELSMIKEKSEKANELNCIYRAYQLSKDAWNSKLSGDYKEKRRLVKDVIVFLDIPKPAPNMTSGLVRFVDAAADALIDRFGITSNTESTLNKSYDDKIMDCVNQLLWEEASKMIIEYEKTWLDARS